MWESSKYRKSVGTGYLSNSQIYPVLCSPAGEYRNVTIVSNV